MLLDSLVLRLELAALLLGIGRSGGYLLLLRLHHQELLGWAYIDHIVDAAEAGAEAPLTVGGVVVVVTDRGTGVVMVLTAS